MCSALRDLLASKKQETWVDYSSTKTRPWKHDVIQQTTELNIVATDDQENHKVGKLAKEQWVALLQGLADKKHVTITTTTNGSS